MWYNSTNNRDIPVLSCDKGNRAMGNGKPRVLKRVDTRMTEQQLETILDATTMLGRDRSGVIRMLTCLLEGAGRYSFLTLRHEDGNEYTTLVLDDTVLLFERTTRLLSTAMSVDDLKRRYMLAEGILVPYDGTILTAIFLR